MMFKEDKLAIIRNHIGHFDPATVILNQEGTLNDIYIVQDRVFRFPKDEQAKRLLRREIEYTNQLHQLVSIPIVNYDLVEPDFGSYRMIKGEELTPRYLEAIGSVNRQQIANELAYFLRSIHSLSIDSLERSPAFADESSWQQFAQRIETHLLPTIPFQFTRQKIERYLLPIRDGLFATISLQAIHGDFGPWHILVNRQPAQVNGILDFGTFGLGDPATDIAAIIFNLGERFLQLMLLEYPAIITYLERARFIADTLPLQWALKGIRSTDRYWYLLHLDREIDRLI